MRINLVTFLLVSLSCAASAQRMPLPSVTLAPGSGERIFAFTNRNNAFFCGIANGANSSGFHGVTRDKRKLFENIRLLLGDSLLDPATATVTVTPAQLVRRYPFANTREEWTFADSLTLLILRVTTEYRGEAAVIPMWSAAFSTVTGSAGGGRLTVTSGITGSAAVLPARGQWEAPDPTVVARMRNPAPAAVPAWYATRIDADTLLVAVEFSPAGTPQRTRADLAALEEAKRERVLAGLESFNFRCGDAAVQDAVRWVIASMDALVMEHADGIYAGLPWFDDFWGRDTFIAFRGALLVTGRFEEARDVLRAFMARQNTDASDSSYGRIPNRVQPGETIYNTADGTPLFVRAVYDYVNWSGDTAFPREAAPALRRALAGTLRYHCDASGCIVHGDAETWMDAVGPDGPWSPRGKTALEIQTLWLGQAQWSRELFRFLGDKEDQRLADSIRRIASDGLWKRFARNNGNSFSPEGELDERSGIPDHINGDGSADTTIRPNVFLIQLGVNTLPYPVGAWMTALEHCVSRDGVASLSFSDPNFHPWHEEPRRYPKDAAYHNGTIWTWLTGPVVSTLCQLREEDSAWILTSALLRLLHDQGAIGTLPECTDACPRPGHDAPRWSGTFSQAWSDAELLRTIVEDYMGLQGYNLESRRYSPRQPRCHLPELHIGPALPSFIPSIGCTVRVGSIPVDVFQEWLPDRRMRIRVRNCSSQASICITTGGGDPALTMLPYMERRLQPGAMLDTVVSVATLKALLGTDSTRHAFTFAACRGNYPVLAPRAGLELDASTVLQRNPSAEVIADMQDAAGDDAGASGTHTYPTGPHFKPGMFDILSFLAQADERNVYFTLRFRALTQPGWHPEYGFQLTMAAVAVDQTPNAETGAVQLGFNSRYAFPAGFSADRVILIGGGVQVIDAKGKVLAEYVPVTESEAFGNASTGTISFAIPRSVLGVPSKDWRWIVAAGAQDDHGGGGIGEFRAVLPVATEWNGGGNAAGANGAGGGNASLGANVYDVLGP
jgi:glycogen debranching enzyme